MTQDYLKSILDYDADSGVFRWVISPRANVKKGAIAGMINSEGYRIIKINSRGLSAHRLAWLWCNGAWPLNEIDHINGDRDDNRISNLRQATRAENNRNVNIRRDNSSGKKGVTWHKGKWYVQIQYNKKRTYLGSFSDLELAANAYAVAEKNMFGEFARRPA